MLWNDIITAGAVIGALMGIGGAMVLIWKRYLIVKKKAESIAAMIKVFPDLQKTLNETARIVNRELCPNGGGSIFDTVKRIDYRQVASEARVRALLQAQNVPFWEAAEDGQTIFVSRALCRLSGRTPEEILGRAWINMVDPEHCDRVESEWYASVREQREFSMEYSYLRPDGTRVPIRAETYIMRGPDGRVLGFLGVASLVPALPPRTAQR